MPTKEKRARDWIKIITPENKEMIASPSYIKKLLNIDLSNIYNRLQSAEYKIGKLGSSSRQETIINLLRENGKHNLIWIQNRVNNYQWYDLRDLITKGIIIETKSKTHTMYELSARGDES